MLFGLISLLQTECVGIVGQMLKRLINNDGFVGEVLRLCAHFTVWLCVRQVHDLIRICEIIKG